MNITDNAQKYKPLIITVICIFSTLSAITTYYGVKLIWGDTNVIITEVMSIGIALGTSLFMIYISIRMIEKKQEYFWSLIVGYFCIAFLSLFFNFSAIHGRQVKSMNLKNEVINLRDAIVQAKIQGTEIIKESLKINEIEDEINRLRAEMKIEEEHYQRPGRGPRYHKLKEKYELAKASLKTSMDIFIEKKALIDSIYEKAISSLDNSLKLDHENKYVDALKDNYKELMKILAVIKSFNREINIVGTKALNDSIIDSDRPDFAMLTLIDVMTNIFSSTSIFTKHQIATIYLSLFISFLLDFPVFFCIVVLNYPRASNQKKRMKKEKNVSDLFSDEVVPRGSRKKLW